MSKKLILIRHGESIWNYENRFTGWANIGLTNLGTYQANNAAKILKTYNIVPQIAFTSQLKRSIDTNKIILNNLELKIPIYHTWRLNEKHYGKITGYNRDELKWKGNFFEIPPIIKEKGNIKIIKNSEYNPNFGESYYMTYLRMVPFANVILNYNQDILICAHKNSLKVLIKYIENLDNDETQHLDIPNSVPIIYTFNNNLKLKDKLILGI